jgi:cyclophilin family peptidyl-prolyl cis-trans isomerase
MKNLKLIALFLIIMVSSCKSPKYTDLDDGLYASIDTKYGDILLKLEFEKTPMTVANFVSLAEGTNGYVKDKFKGKRYYDGLKFHRVVKGFMIQGGDPLGTGMGDPGYKFKDEFHKDLKHDKAGILSMANGGPNTNGSQFFITLNPTPGLDNKHTVFGHVVKGQEIVEVFGNLPVVFATSRHNVADKPLDDHFMEKVEIFRFGKAAKDFDAKAVFEKGFAEMEEEVKKRLEDEKLEKEKIKAHVAELLKLESNAKKYPSGLKVLITKEGTGIKPKAGQSVSMHYSGYLKNGNKFDSSYKRNKPFKTQIGIGRVIQGWDEGVVDLKVGTKAILFIPPHLGYGDKAIRNVIPANSDLIFEVELLEILK